MMNDERQALYGFSFIIHHSSFRVAAFIISRSSFIAAAFLLHRSVISPSPRRKKLYDVRALRAASSGAAFRGLRSSRSSSSSCVTKALLFRQQSAP
jgi:hypothetical protein